MHLLVLDGNSILNRAFYGIRLLSNKEGFHTNAIYGFLNILNKLKENFKPEITTVAFDLKAPTFRHKFYKEYKAQRKPMPAELMEQVPVLKELLVLLGYKIIEKEGFEADDILGTLANICEKNKKTCLIATGDKDSLQLVSEYVNVNIASTKVKDLKDSTYTEKKILEEFSVTPKQLIEVKALMGDTSDNIPGIAGVGPKTAFKLIKDYGSVDHIYENIENLDIKKNLKEKLLNGKDSAFLSKYLGTIVKNVPINGDLNFYKNGSVKEKEARDLLEKLEMFTFIKKFSLYEKSNEVSGESIGFSNIGIDPEKVEIINYQDKDLSVLKEKIFKEGNFFFFLDLKKDFHKIIIVLKDRTLNVVSKENKNYFDFLKDVLESEKIKKETYNSKEIFLILKKINIDVKNIDFDVLLADYLLNPEKKDHSIKSIAIKHGTYLSESFKEKLKIEEDSLEEETLFCSLLAPILKEEIKENNLENLLKEIEQPLSLVLASMQNVGVLVDVEAIENYSQKLNQEIKNITSNIHEFISEDVNINSPKQLGEVLFNDLSIPIPKKGKTKSYSTSAEVLESLKNYHPVISLILKYRTLTKLNSTYCTGLLSNISKTDGRIHSVFNQTETKTGRLSSLNPNLQNIPVRKNEGREIRKFFIAKENNVLIDADYSQIELRVLAHICEDENLISAFKNDKDIHKAVASEIFNLPANMITDFMRSSAKVVNFGIIYGMSGFSLAKDLNITKKEAEDYIENYFSHYPKVKKYLDKTIEEARKTGFVKTLFGRKLHLQDLNSKKFILRSAAERIARNMPIQGTAADIIKMAMLRVFKKLKEENLKSRLVLQIHDELIVESPVEELDMTKGILKNEMQNAANLLVPLTVNIGIGKSWYDAK